MRMQLNPAIAVRSFVLHEIISEKQSKFYKFISMDVWSDK